MPHKLTSFFVICFMLGHCLSIGNRLALFGFILAALYLAIVHLQDLTRSREAKLAKAERKEGAVTICHACGRRIIHYTRSEDISFTCHHCWIDGHDDVGWRKDCRKCNANKEEHHHAA